MKILHHYPNVPVKKIKNFKIFYQKVVSMKKIQSYEEAMNVYNSTSGNQTTASQKLQKEFYEKIEAGDEEIRNVFPYIFHVKWPIVGVTNERGDFSIVRIAFSNQIKYKKIEKIPTYLLLEAVFNLGIMKNYKEYPELNEFSKNFPGIIRGHDKKYEDLKNKFIKEVGKDFKARNALIQVLKRVLTENNQVYTEGENIKAVYKV